MTTSQNLVIGVDVGSTNTSVACLRGTDVVSYDKVPSTVDVTSGVELAIHNVLEKLAKDEEWSVIRVNIGTTHLIKSLVQRSQLVPVSVVRLCGPATRTLGPFDGFPDDLRTLIGSKCFYVNGGYQIDGSVITDVDEKEILAVIKEIKESEIRNVVISGVFSSKNNNQEKQVVGQLFAENFPEASLTLSSEIFSHGLLERENAAILNETLKPLCRATLSTFSDVVNKLCLGCPLFFTQNDGTLMSAPDAVAFPVKIISSGPYNSMLGACHLSGVKDAIVVDTGGTTSTVGSLQEGLPRLSSLDVCLGGVNTNLRMPDVISIGLGGGSVVTYEVVDDLVKVEVGPNSVRKRLKEKALVFGGSVLTASDIAALYLKADLGDSSKVKVSSAILEEANKRIQNMLEDVTDQMKAGRHALPVIFVGGGSILKDISRSMEGVTENILPAHYQATGAVGAALCQMSGYDDTPKSITGTSKESLDQPKILHQMLDETEAGSSDLRATDTPMSLHLHEEGGMTGHGTGQYENIFRQRNPGKDIEPKVPYVDKSTGEWVLSEYDVHCISIGAGILGSGGGGSAKIGLLRALTTLKRGQKIRVIHPKRLASKSFKGGRVGIAGIMGSPVALLEKMTNGREIVESLTSLEKVSKTDLLEDNNTQKLVVQGDNDRKYVTDFDPTLLEVTQPGARGLVALMCFEIGGLNTMEMLSTGAAMDLPIVDCDGCGRAVPELQMFTPSIYGLPLCPAALVDEKGHKELLLSAKSPNDIEDHFRKVLGRMGSLAAFSSRPMSETEVLDTCIMFSISRCFKLGDTIRRAQKENKDPIQSICEHEGGVHLITGKVVSVSNVTTKAFDRGLIEIEGTGKYADQGMVIHFQNENLIAKRGQNGQEKVVATIPDIIAVFGINDGRAVMNEDIKNGMRVAVIALASGPQLRTDNALKFVGPRAVGYDFDFIPVGEHQFHDAIPPPP
ncbi:hypothetical protein HOLleu_07119 [Holothuria leucospilota]|uniref:Hydantoinase n=1 Tax=Holothuria leucospilota TaxID=206669 RepID=A0A9Q1HFV3_HOLLE|nr:hypothetical protein HOLleu_07119 [Holothuria leucospilota]